MGVQNNNRIRILKRNVASISTQQPISPNQPVQKAPTPWDVPDNFRGMRMDDEVLVSQYVTKLMSAADSGLQGLLVRSRGLTSTLNEVLPLKKIGMSRKEWLKLVTLLRNNSGKKGFSHIRTDVHKWERNLVFAANLGGWRLDCGEEPNNAIYLRLFRGKHTGPQNSYLNILFMEDKAGKRFDTACVTIPKIYDQYSPNQKQAESVVGLVLLLLLSSPEGLENLLTKVSSK